MNNNLLEEQKANFRSRRPTLTDMKYDRLEAVFGMEMLEEITLLEFLDGDSVDLFVIQPKNHNKISILKYKDCNPIKCEFLVLGRTYTIFAEALIAAEKKGWWSRIFS